MEEIPWFSNWRTEQREIDAQLAKNLPLIRRTRGYYLYSIDNVRIFDMYLGNGRAIFGHKPFQLTQHLKQAIDQGLLSALPHPYHARLFAILREYFDKYRFFYLFPQIAAAITVLRDIAHARKTTFAIIDPIQSTLQHGMPRTLIAWWRAHLPIPNADILLPIIPHPASHLFQIVCSNIALDSAPAHTLIAPIEMYAAQHILTRMRAMRTNPIYAKNRTDIIDPLSREEHQRCRVWRSNRYYLTSTVSQAQHTILFKKLLQNNILINPLSGGVTVLPPQCPKKEYLKFVRISDTLIER